MVKVGRMMKFLDEYHDPAAMKILVQSLHQTARQPWTIMEVCGGQTHTIVKHGLDRLLPPSMELLHGPGCPVCVTPLEVLDKAIEIAARPEVIFCSFGDMLRVPGSGSDLLSVKARGGEVRVVYSPLDAVALAERYPDRSIVFLAVGFETTAPANALAVWDARRRGLKNFFVLVAHVLVPPALRALMATPDHRMQAFLAAGHVCTVVGYEEYEPLAEEFRVPIVVTGFEPLDLLEGIFLATRMLEEGRWGVENQYCRVVQRQGNLVARRIVDKVFTVVDRPWRGLGVIPRSGLALRDEYSSFDADRHFCLETLPVVESTVCMSGEVLRGRIKPRECPAFGTQCTPLHPMGATMVSSEGACAAYYHYGNQEDTPSAWIPPKKVASELGV